MRRRKGRLHRVNESHLELEAQLLKQWKKQQHPWRRRLIKVSAVVGLLVGSLGGYWVVTAPKLAAVFPDAKHARLFAKTVNLTYEAQDGQVIYQTSPSNYAPMTVQDVRRASWPIKALIATEDRQFYREGGINVGHTIKAAIDTGLGRGVVGGSTLTQQLIKLTFFSTSKKDQTIKRKAQEIYLAIQLNHRYSKRQILAWYLTKANFGNGQQGLKAASQYYYRKSPDQLNAVQAATLVGMVNSPATYNPYLNPRAMTFRRNVVLNAMHANGVLSTKAWKAAKQTPVDGAGLVLAKQNVQDVLAKRDQHLQYSDFVSAVNAQLDRYDPRLRQTTLTVKTTMNKGLQDRVNQIVKDTHYPDDQLQEAIVVINNQTGDVVAMSGGRNQTVVGGYSRAFAARRSSGSAIKPLLDYAPVFELKNWGADTKISDRSYTYPGTNQQVHDWDDHYQGDIDVRQALVQSRNVPAVKALATVGLDQGQLVLEALGLPAKSLFYANAIGLDVNPLALASAYTSLANNGVRSNARLVQQLDTGTVQLTTKPQQETVFSPDVAWQITDILKGVFTGDGTATKAQLKGIHQAGKTGTVGREDPNHKDALTDGWMVGYTKTWTVAVWVGYDDPYDQDHYLTNEKAYVGQDLYKQVMEAASKLPGSDNSDWKRPDDRNKTKPFANAANRSRSYLPFTLNQLPQDFLNTPANAKLDQPNLPALYRRVNQGGKS